MRIKTITSAQNPLIKELVLLLEKSKKRKAEGLFIAEGLREISLCVRGGYKIEKLIYAPQIVSLEKVLQETGINPQHCEIIETDEAIFAKLAYRSSIENAVVVVSNKSHSLKAVNTGILKQHPFSLVIAGIEKPGNLGAILRSADATGSMVIVCDPTCDLYNPNVIRGSVGTVFTTRIYMGSREEVVDFLNQYHYTWYTTFMESNSMSLYDCELSSPSAVVLGTESSGLDEIWRKEQRTNVNLPMAGVVDSLNVSVAASVIMYEALRRNTL